MIKIYLANPWGFGKLSNDLLIPELIDAIESAAGQASAISPSLHDYVQRLSSTFKVVEPFATNSHLAKDHSGDKSWAWKIARANKQLIDECHAVFAVVNGCPPDEGVFWECGYAAGTSKPVFFFRDDFRKCTDNPMIPVNLMLLANTSEKHVQAHWYETLDSIADPNKGFYRWVKRCMNEAAIQEKSYQALCRELSLEKET